MFFFFKLFLTTHISISHIAIELPHQFKKQVHRILSVWL
uniref:Uncharacterized protein n=1 Tax=Rhizophora mucronata TaxID=61149 RepID=A0A2P2Q1J8_RHIMU